MEKGNLFSISLKLALVILFIALVNIFMVPRFSAEFYILFITIVLMLIMVLIGSLMIRRRKEWKK